MLRIVFAFVMGAFALAGLFWFWTRVVPGMAGETLKRTYEQQNERAAERKAKPANDQKK